MAKKPSLTNITSGYASATTYNSNNDAIETAFVNTISRDGSTPNTMSADLDMDGHNIVNAGIVTSSDNPQLIEAINVKQAGATGDGTTDDTAAIDSAKTDADTKGVALYFPDGQYLYSGTVYTIDKGSVWFDSDFSGGVNPTKELEQKILLLTASTADTSPIDNQEARVPIGVTVEARGAHHASGIRSNLNNSSTDGNGNTAFYGRATSDTDANWSAAQHGETRHGGGTSIALSGEAASYNTAGAFYGAVINNTTNGAETTHPITGAAKAEHPNATGLLVQGTRSTDPQGAWRLGVLFGTDSLRDPGTAIENRSPVAATLRTTTAAVASEADIILEGDSQLGIALNGSYVGGNAIRMNNDQGLSLSTDGTKKVKWNSTLGAFEFVGGPVFSKQSPHNVKAYGAVGDGVTDDSAAIGNWLDALIAQDAHGFLPDGDYLLGSAIEKTVSTVRMGFSGNGAGSARFIVPNTNSTGGIIITSTARDSQVRFSGFSVLKRGTGGVGFAFRQPEGGSQHQRTVIARDIAVRGENNTDEYFDNFLSFQGTWRPLLDGIVIDGPWVGVDNTDASLRFAANVGIDLDGAYDPTVSNVHIWGVSRGIRSNVYQGTITSFADNGSGGTRVTVSNGPHPFSTGFDVSIENAGSPYDGDWSVTNVSSTEFDIPVAFTATSTGNSFFKAGPEAFRLTDYVINGCRVALDYVRPSGREPIVWVDNGHYNYRDFGLRLEGAKLVNIHANVPYNEDSGSEFSGVPYDIHLVNASEFIITGNVFRFPGHPSRIPVKVENDGTAGSGDNGLIQNNIFDSDGDYAVWLSTGVSGVKVGPNVYPGTYASGLINDVSRNNDVIDGKTETEGTWTPALTFGGGNTGMTVVSAVGKWKIVGGVIHLNIAITLSAKGTSTGNAEVSLPTVLPTSDTIQAGEGGLIFQFYSGMSGISSPAAWSVSAAALRLANQNATAIGNLTETNFTDSSRVELSGTLFLG